MLNATELLIRGGLLPLRKLQALEHGIWPLGILRAYRRAAPAAP
jgi:hypothetical protein